MQNYVDLFWKGVENIQASWYNTNSNHHQLSRVHQPVRHSMASFLRRRVFGSGDANKDKNREDTPEKAEQVRLAPISKIITEKNPKPKIRKRRTGFIFALGGLFGLVAAGVFAGRNDLIDFPDDFSVEGLLDVLPASLIKDARDLQVSLLSVCEIDHNAWKWNRANRLAER